MATITVSIPNIAGESTVEGHTDKLDAVSIFDTVQSGTGAGNAKLSEILLTRIKDRASPKLAEKCATGTSLGDITISVFRNVGTGPKVFLKYTLTATYVSRIEYETVESGGIAYMPHVGYSQGGAPSWRPLALSSGANVNDVRGYARARAAPNPIYDQPLGVFGVAEVERVWLNSATVKWTYTPYVGDVAGGAVEHGWNLLTHAVL